MRALQGLIAFCSVAACAPDESRLRDLVPSFFQIAAVESTDYTSSCFRATYLVNPPPDGRFELLSWSKDGRKEYGPWHRMDYMGSSTFHRCVDAEEQALWQPAIDSGVALETGVKNDWTTRIWYDPVELRLLVLVYYN
jgi:hypothetical protein